MGQGGYITLINGTKNAWKKEYQHSYQMNSWNFSGTVPPGVCPGIYLYCGQKLKQQKKGAPEQ